MKRFFSARSAVAFAFVIVVLCNQAAHAQTASMPQGLRAGQTVYIVAYMRTQLPTAIDPATGNATGTRDYFDYDLDTERKIRKEIEQWQFFRVADKPSTADFIFLVNINSSSIEGLALPFEAYRQHFKEKFDLDALRDAAFGRYMAGPLNLATKSRLTDRLIKEFRQKVSGGVNAKK